MLWLIKTDPGIQLLLLTFRAREHKVISMEMMGEIRRMHFRDKLSLHRIAKHTGLSRNIIRKRVRALKPNSRCTSGKLLSTSSVLSTKRWDGRLKPIRLGQKATAEPAWRSLSRSKPRATTAATDSDRLHPRMVRRVRKNHYVTLCR